MNGKKIFRIAIFMGILGFIILGVLWLSGVSYPHLLFKIFMPIGMLMIFASLCIGFIGWFLMIKDAIISKMYRWAGSLFLMGVIIILREVFRLMFK